MGQKVYLVTAGEYSDYHLCSVHSTAEKANLAKKLFASENDIKEFEVDSIPDHPEGLFPYCVFMDKEGCVRWIGLKSVEDFEPESGKPTTDGKTVVFSMWAEDETHAIKIANEQRIGLILSGEWTSGWNEWLERHLARLKKSEQGT